MKDFEKHCQEIITRIGDLEKIVKIGLEANRNEFLQSIKSTQELENIRRQREAI